MSDRCTAQEEIWKPIPGWPEYEASSLGRIASVKRGDRQILSGGKTDTGYRNVLLYRKGDRVGRRVHQLVALTFLGPRPEGLEIRHLDGDQINNAVSNLAYGTHAENMADRRRHNGRLLIVGMDPVPTWATKAPRNRRHARAKTTHCRKGHLRTEATTYQSPGGKRICRPCKTAWESESRRLRAFRAAGIEVAA